MSYSPGFSGSGQGATVDVVVGQGSSVINFELRNPGFGYGNGERLTVSVGGTIGIPTDPTLSFERFEILVDEVYSDRFNSWGMLVILKFSILLTMSLMDSRLSSRLLRMKYHIQLYLEKDLLLMLNKH